MYDVSIKEFFTIVAQGQFYELICRSFKNVVDQFLRNWFGGRGDVNVTFDFVSGSDRDIRIREVLTEYLGPTARPTE